MLASHTHPSVSTMAGTLLSGANIVYNGNPLNDLTLTAFLDKFMEKKPKTNTWHGGSQIEPAKKVWLNTSIIFIISSHFTSVHVMIITILLRLFDYVYETHFLFPSLI